MQRSLIIVVAVLVVIIIIFVMMVNLDNSQAPSSVGFGLEDLIHLNNNNHEGSKEGRESPKTDIEKVRFCIVSVRSRILGLALIDDLNFGA